MFPPAPPLPPWAPLPAYGAGNKVKNNVYWPFVSTDVFFNGGAFAISSPITVNAIFYGDNVVDTTVLRTLVNGLTSTPLWPFVREYAVSDVVRIGRTVLINNASTLFTGSTISAPAVIASAVNAGLLQISPTSFVTLVLTDGVDDGGGCAYCGYHQSFHTSMHLLTVPNPVNFLYQVIPPVYPVGGGGACMCDQVAAVVHELVESAVNSAYYDFPDNNEVMDLCELVPGVPVVIGGQTFNIPQVWSNALNACSNATQVPPSPTSSTSHQGRNVTLALSVSAALLFCGLLSFWLYRRSRVKPPVRNRRVARVYTSDDYDSELSL